MNHSDQTRARWAAVAGVPVLFLAIALLQTRIDRQEGTVAQEEALLLQSPAAIKEISLGYESLLADIYWTRAVQYYGERAGIEGAKFDLLWPLLNIATTLDPKLIVAYRFGVIFLSEPEPGGAERPDLAIELVRRGIAANPNQWQLNADLGLLYYWRLKDYANASEQYLEASKKPEAPPWLAMMAGRIAQQGGSLDTSSMIWSELYQSTQDPAIKDNAMKMLRGIQAEKDESQLNQLAEEYRTRTGRYPTSTNELLEAGLLRGIPVDAAGYPYVFGPDGKSALSPQSTVSIPPEPKLPPTPDRPAYESVRR
jgi:hypothetical protein